MRQFKLRTLFLLTMLAAMISAMASIGYRIWQSLDSLAQACLSIALPPAIFIVLFIGVLPFAYRRAVREISARQCRADESPRSNG